MKRRLALLAALSAADVLAGNAPPLFTEILDASQPTPPRTQAVYPVIVNFTPLDSGTDNLELVLPGSAGGTYTALRVRFEQRPGGGYHWIGKTGTHDVILTVDGDLITGFIRGGGETYSVISGVAGGSTSHALMRMDPESFPSDYVEGEAQVAKSVVVEKGALPEFPEAQCFGSTKEPIDLLIAYSPEALGLSNGSVEVLTNQLENAVAAANVTLTNSDIAATVNAVAIEPAPANLVEQRIPDDLANARNNVELQARRRLHKADIAVFYTSSGMNGSLEFCGATRTQRRAGNLFWGIGYDFYDSAVMVLTHQCAVQDNALSHEIGHIAGLDHNPPYHAVGTPETNLYPFSFGHHVDGEFRDQMSGSNLSICPNGCPKEMFFSDPNMFTNGFARGTSARSNAETYRRMVRCTNRLADYVFIDDFE